jgi:hypothetical protein
MPAVWRALILLLVLTFFRTDVQAASVASPNFLVTAASEAVARRVADAAEYQRRKLAVLWYGHELDDWASRCTVEVDADPNKGAGGSTSFKFSGGEVYGWRMRVQGSVERILDSVIPHEVNHTILACYFRRKVPRWADEGAATIFEHDSERQRQIDEIQQLMHDGRRIPLRVLMSMTQYPSDMSQVMAMYAQSYSVTDYLIQKAGRQTFLAFLNDAHRQGWDAALKTHYEQKSVEHLEQEWTGWVMAGFPRLNLPPGQLLAETTAADGMIVRGQSPAATEAAVSGQSVESEQPTDPTTTAAFRSLPVPSLRPAVKVATHLRASWRHTAAALSRVKDFGGELLDHTSPPRDEALESSEVTPLNAPAVPAAEQEDLRPLELIPIISSQSSRTPTSAHRRFVAVGIQKTDRENPFATPADGLSRLSGASASNAGLPSWRELRETRLHRQPEASATSQTLSDWGRFPGRIR